MSRFTRASAVATSAVAALALAACSSSGGKEETSGGGGGGAGGVDTPEMTVSFITHAEPGDTFWDQVRAGAEDAAKKNNVKLEYTANPEGAQQANLVQQAVDGDIPVVALNAGMDAWKDMGALSFFGQDDELAGEAAGERLTEEKAGKTLCVIQEQGHVGLEGRCKGVAKTFDKSEKIYVKGTDTANVQSTITAKLQDDKEITHVLTLGAPFALIAQKSVNEAGSDAEVATFDLNDEALQQIKDGNIIWAVDQQPYVQGYQAVDSLWLRVNKGASVGGGEPSYTGPAFVDEKNVDQLLED